MSDNTIKINRIPSLTWNWLKMNETEIEVKPVCVPEDDFKVNVPADVTFETGPADHCSDIKGALGEVFDEDMKQISGHTDIIRVGEGVKCKEPVVIYGDFKRECAAFNRYVIEAGKDSELTVLIELSSDFKVPRMYPDAHQGRGRRCCSYGAVKYAWKEFRCPQ